MSTDDTGKTEGVDIEEILRRSIKVIAEDNRYPRRDPTIVSPKQFQAWVESGFITKDGEFVPDHNAFHITSIENGIVTANKPWSENTGLSEPMSFKENYEPIFHQMDMARWTPTPTKRGGTKTKRRKRDRWKSR